MSGELSGLELLAWSLKAEFSEAHAYVSLLGEPVDTASEDSDAPLDGTIVLRDPLERSTTLLNRVFGLGLRQPATDAAIEALRGLYEPLGLPWSVEVTPAAADAAMRATLKRHRLRRGLPTAVLAFDCDRIEASESAHTIRRVDGEAARAAAAVEAEVFGVSARLHGLLGEASTCSRFRQWVAVVDDLPVAACLTHLAEDTAWFGWSATLPAFRGRGIQSAMLVACARDARAQGCRWMTAETAVGTDECPDASYRNLRRLGFRELYRRHAYIRMPSRPAKK
jgi:ribosomal protein S18 acetylase RimI-like enzyme